MAMERMYYVAESIIRLVYVNILAILFSLSGVIIFGFFPAVMATFFIIRKWLIGYSDIHITKHFWQTFKREFLRSNVAGWLLTLLGLLLYINLSIAEVIGHSVIQLSYYPITIVFIIFLCLCLFVAPIYLHFQVSLAAAIKQAFLILFVHPLNTLFMIAVIVVLYTIMKIVPGFIPIFGISSYVFIIMWFSLRTFDRVNSLEKEG